MLKKEFANSTKMDLISLRNESTLRVFLVEISTENIYQSYGSWCVGLSDTKHVHVGMPSPALGSAVLHWGTDVVVRLLSICQGLTQKSGLRYTSSIWPYAGCAISTYVRYSLSGIHQHYCSTIYYWLDHILWSSASNDGCHFGHHCCRPMRPILTTHRGWYKLANIYINLVNL